MNVKNCIKVFQQSITDYHVTNSVDSVCLNPYRLNSFEYLLYEKNYIDTVQWHLEDIIRDPHIDTVEALAIKRRIDASNQHRTDLVEKIDDWFMNYFSDVKNQEGAGLNTETPAWALDRLSILELKIYHMRAETERSDTSPEHSFSCKQKLNILSDQRADLTLSLQQLADDIKEGKKYMKLYRQMKMYNDASLNPVLYGKSK